MRGWRVGVVGGDGGGNNTFPARLAPPRPPRHLREQVKRLLGRTKVRIAEDGVGREHHRERDVGKVMSLAQHLRADQGLRLALAEAIEDADELPLPPCGVAVEHFAGDVGEIAAEAFLDLFRAEADGLQHLAVAEPALRRDPDPQTPLVADYHPPATLPAT